MRARWATKDRGYSNARNFLSETVFDQNSGMLEPLGRQWPGSLPNSSARSIGPDPRCRRKNGISKRG